MRLCFYLIGFCPCLSKKDIEKNGMNVQDTILACKRTQSNQMFCF